MNLKLKSSIYWAIVWDILWVPFEFMAQDEIQEEWWVKMKWWWTWWEPIWAWSDDTSMLLCTLESLKDWYNIQDIWSKFIQWKNNWLWTSHWYRFDIWNQTLKALKLLENWKQISKEESTDGNGSLMRILPILFFILSDTIENQFKKVSEISSITHPSDICTYWCFIYIKYAELLLLWYNKFDAYEELKKVMRVFLPENIQNIYKNILSKDIRKIENLQTNWYIVSSLELIFYTFLTYNSFEETLIETVKLWWDTDTNGSLVWWLAWLYYWHKTIPKEWIKNIPHKRKINLLFK